MSFYETNVYFISVLLITLGFLFLVRKDVYQVIFGYGVPFVPTADKKVDILMENLEIKKGQNFLDLGSGNGKILEAIENKYKKKYGNLDGLTLTGIENSPYPYKLSMERKEKNNLNYEIKKTDFFKEDFSKYDVIYSYTITYLMNKIRNKIKKECNPGTIFYSNSFKIPLVKEIKKIKTTNKNFIYVYEVE